MKPKRFRDLRVMPASTFKKFHGVSKSEFQAKNVKEEVDEISEQHAEIEGNVVESKEANYGAEYQQSVSNLKAKAEKKPVDMKSLAARMQASYKKDEKKPVKESSYDDNRTGFAKKPREDDEGHAPTKFKAKDPMSRPHTVHIDGKPWKKFDNGHQAHAAANTLSAKGKKATAIAHYKEENMQEEVKDEYARKVDKYLKKKYSKDDTPPFDGPYKKTAKVVTDKSGAKHSPMSRARDLARAAAQRVSKPAKLKESDSRKAAIVKDAVKGKKKTSSEDAFQPEPQLSSTITKNY